MGSRDITPRENSCETRGTVSTGVVDTGRCYHDAAGRGPRTCPPYIRCQPQAAQVRDSRSTLVVDWPVLRLSTSGTICSVLTWHQLFRRKTAAATCSCRLCIEALIMYNFYRAFDADVSADASSSPRNLGALMPAYTVPNLDRTCECTYSGVGSVPCSGTSSIPCSAATAEFDVEIRLGSTFSTDMHCAGPATQHELRTSLHVAAYEPEASSGCEEATLCHPKL